MKRIGVLTSLLCVALLLPVAAFAASTPHSATATATVQYNVAESFTLALSGGPAVIPASGNSNTLSALLSWNLSTGVHTGGMYTAAWFSSASSALVGSNNAADQIPSADITENVTFGPPSANGSGQYVCNQTLNPAFNPITGSVSGATCFNGTILSGTVPSIGNQTDTYSFSLSGSGIPADSYSGTFTLAYYVP